jgi:hypothetical protein
MPTIGTYHVHVIGEFHYQFGERRGTEEMLIGSVEELCNEIEKSIAAGFQKENPFKGFEIGNMTRKTTI